MEKHVGMMAFFLVTVAIVLAGFLIYHQTTPLPVQSSFVYGISPTPIPTPTTKAPEPIVTTWSTYTSTDYNFTLDYPAGWNHQEFTQPYGAKIIAFSPNSLPCANCSYVHDGFFSIKVFNQKTDPQAYSDYTTEKQNAGKSPDIIPVKIGSIPGMLFNNTVTVENSGYIFQLSLDTDNGTDKPTGSQIFQHAALSLTFTNLIFDN